MAAQNAELDESSLSSLFKSLWGTYVMIEETEESTSSDKIQVGHDSTSEEISCRGSVDIFFSRFVDAGQIVLCSRTAGSRTEKNYKPLMLSFHRGS